MAGRAEYAFASVVGHLVPFNVTVDAAIDAIVAVAHNSVVVKPVAAARIGGGEAVPAVVHDLHVLDDPAFAAGDDAIELKISDGAVPDSDAVDAAGDPVPGDIRALHQEAVQVDGHIGVRDLDSDPVRGDEQVAGELEDSRNREDDRIPRRIARRDIAGECLRVTDENFAGRVRLGRRE